MKKVLVVDIGGTNVKAMISREGRRKFASGGGVTPRQLHDMLDGQLDDWKYDLISKKHLGNRCGWSTTPPCKRSEVIAVAACSLLDSEPALVRRWSGAAP